MDLVVGAGEVGTSVAAVLRCRAIDVHTTPESTGVVSLHICFPWSEQFTTHVDHYRAMYRPELVVVHSTVPVGTCNELGVVHSPIRGRHPQLVESLRTFTKFFGGPNAAVAAESFAAVGVPVRVVDRSETTEAGKLWELLMFGLAVAQQKEMYRWCTERGADPDVAYREFTETYNAGYQSMGLGHVTRPIIDPMPGPIGGHCVIQNTSCIDHALAHVLLDLDATW